MKKFSTGLITGLLLGFLLATTTFAVAAPQAIKLIIDGEEIQCDVPPQLINGRVLVPARFVAEPLGAKVEWDENQRAVLINSTYQQQLSSKSVKDNLIGYTDLRTLGERYKLYIWQENKDGAKYIFISKVSPDTLSTNDLYVKFPWGEPIGEVIQGISNNGLTVQGIVQNGRLYVLESDLQETGIIP